MSVVFAAGFLVPQQFAGMDYFRGAKAAFPDALFPPVPPAADVSTRAQALANRINTAFPNGPIHIVAHSMAGLDTRFLLTHNLCGLAAPGRVTSLSTISTPHGGTPVADFLVGPTPSIIDPRWVAYQGLVQLAGTFGLSIGALGDLTGSFASTFNPQNRNLPHVNYYCYAGSGTGLFPLLQLSHWYIDSVGQTPDDKANDCLVSVKSASLIPLAEATWPTDHFGEVGYSLTNPPTFASPFDHISAYRRILSRAGA